MPGSQQVNELVTFLTSVAVGDGAVIISPHPDPFRPFERSFLDGIRRCPATISAPAGTNPYSATLRKPGRWMFVWIPEK